MDRDREPPAEGGEAGGRGATEHLIALDERHLLRLLKEAVEYYNASHTHVSLEKDSQVDAPGSPVRRPADRRMR